MPEQEWPTLEQINWFRFGDPLTKRALICDAAEWAVESLPKLRVLEVEMRKEAERLEGAPRYRAYDLRNTLAALLPKEGVMPVPKEWPTLEEVRGWKRRERGLPANQRIANAAEFAVTVRPQLEALVEELNRKGDDSDPQRSMLPHVIGERAAFRGVAYVLERLIATPHEEHEETEVHCPGCASQGDRLTSLERSVVEEIRRDLGRQQPPHRLRAALLVIDRVAPRPGGSEG